MGLLAEGQELMILAYSFWVLSGLGPGNLGSEQSCQFFRGLDTSLGHFRSLQVFRCMVGVPGVGLIFDYLFRGLVIEQGWVT